MSPHKRNSLCYNPPMPTQIPPPKLDSVPFGAQSISPHEKPHKIQSLFNNIAPHYNLMNDLMSLGLHRIWQQHLLLNLAPLPHETLWDAAGGTANIALKFLQKGGKHATITDISHNMLEIGKQKATKKNLLHKTTFLEDNMENSQLKTQNFHSVTCAWGLRNTTNIHKALAEMYRCLRFGGKIIVLEFAPKPIPQIQKIYKTWCNHILPKLGKHIANSEESYLYLAESIQRFITPQELNAAMKNARFSRCTTQTLGAGIAALHKGWKL